MKNFSSLVFALATSVCVASFAHAASPTTTTSPLVTPPPLTLKKSRYTPSVPARKPQTIVQPNEAAPAKVINVPSMPVSPAEIKKETPAVVADTAPLHANDLSTALAKAYNFNPELQSFRSRVKATDEQIPQAYAGWLPAAKIDYSYGYDKEHQAGTRARIPGTHPETKSLTITQPIFNGGETLARTDRAYDAVAIARAQLTDSEQRILSDAVKAYMDVVRTDEILKLSVNNEQVLQEQLQATRDRFKLGETTRTDVAQSEARLARATSDKVSAAGNLDVAKATYLRVIGEAARNTKMPTALPPIPKSLDEALNTGLAKNPILISADITRDVAERDIRIAQSVLLPTVSVRGSKTDEDGLNVLRGRSIKENSVTLNASIPIYQSGAEYSRVRQGKRVKQQRKEEYEATRNETVENVTSRWRDIITARASIVSNKSTVESATVALNGVRQEADVGTRTTLDVLDAEQELFIAKVNLVTAEAREVVAVYTLLAAMGTLTAPDLALNVEPYDPTIHERSVKYRVIGF